MTNKIAQPRRSKGTQVSQVGRPPSLIPLQKKYRVSGHESFACRYTWLPKAVHGLQKNTKLFVDESRAMVDLGVGKNMVRSIRFWAQAAGIVTAAKNCEYTLTDFGVALLGERGRDPFLEDI